MKKLIVASFFLMFILPGCKKEVIDGNNSNAEKASRVNAAVNYLFDGTVAPVSYLPDGSTILGHSKPSSGVFLGSPSICFSVDGKKLIAIYELNGASAARTSTGETITKVLRSTDSGKTWTKLSDINGQYMSTVFTHGTALYIMGLDKYKGNVIIRKSTNDGSNWTSPVVVKSGLHHGASGPVLKANGRLWRAVETVETNSTIWPQMYKPWMMSIKDTDDLMVANNWKTTTNGLNYNSTYYNGYFRGWLEGNAVIGTDNQVKLVLRVFDWSKINEKIAIANVNVSVNGPTFISSSLSFSDPSGFKLMPGGQKKFSIKKIGSTYYTLSNVVQQTEYDRLANISDKYVSDIRNTLALISSTDLENWTVNKILLYDSDFNYHGYQYADWVMSGNDIYAVVRTADDDADGKADSHHNANYITFHKFTK
jgi:hypothetical protein